MSLLANYKRIMAEELDDEGKLLLEGLTTFAVHAMDAGYNLGTDLGQASRLELVARASATRRREVRRIVNEGKAAMGGMALVEVLEEVDGGQAGADLVANTGIALARSRASARKANPSG